MNTPEPKNTPITVRKKNNLHMKLHIILLLHPLGNVQVQWERKEHHGSSGQSFFLSTTLVFCSYKLPQWASERFLLQDRWNLRCTQHWLNPAPIKANVNFNFDFNGRLRPTLNQHNNPTLSVLMLYARAVRRFGW